jgi:UPF0755 protein
MSRKIQKRGFFMKRWPSYQALKKWLTLAAVLLGVLYGAIFLLPIVPNQSNTVDGSSYRVKINPNSGLTSIADQLSKQGLMVNSVALHLGSRSLWVASKLKPGTYLLPNGASLGKVLLQIARGDRVRESIAIVPGMTIWQLRSLMDSQSAMIHRTKGMSDKELLQQLNLNYSSDEGLFLPDTYVFDPDELDLNIYRRAAQAMQKQLMQIWEQRDSGLPLKTPYELLILASIVEKETGRLSDRNLVSAVFINRLNKGMQLQTDPTVIYGIGPKFDGNLKKADLRRDTPYNTYMRKGLPPTPIAMPGKESILAAAHPAKSNALFFVAKGDGSSHFSQNLKEHEAAVDRYQRKIMPKNNSN